MNTTAQQGYGLIIISFLLALLLSIFSLPDWLQALRPQWLALLVIYWCLTAPERVGISIAWLAGLLLDVLTGNLLGQNALGMALVAFITLNIYQRTRIFPLWQQSLVVFGLLLLAHSLNFWIIGITENITPGLTYWFPPLVGMLLWPWLYILLGEARHRMRQG